MILGAFNIKYMPRTSIKGQVLVDLVAKFAESPIEIVAEQRNVDGKLVGVISALRPHVGRCTLMMQQIKEDSEWD